MAWLGNFRLSSFSLYIQIDLVLSFLLTSRAYIATIMQDSENYRILSCFLHVDYSCKNCFSINTSTKGCLLTTVNSVLQINLQMIFINRTEILGKSAAEHVHFVKRREMGEKRLKMLLVSALTVHVLLWRCLSNYL